jgi:hypothetical protein
VAKPQQNGEKSVEKWWEMVEIQPVLAAFTVKIVV